MKNKLKSLHLFDVIILAMIFFGFAIYSSNMQFFELISHEQVAPRLWNSTVQAIGRGF